MYRTRIAPLCFIAALTHPLAHAAEETQTHIDVESTLNAISHTKIENKIGTYGDLSATGRKDWAGVIYFDLPDQGRMRQIVVLTQDADGRYRVASKSEPVSADGGTGHYGIDELEIKRNSLFIWSSWNWHGCGGGAKHQFKYYRGDWRLLGVNFWRSNVAATANGAVDLLDSVNIGRNVLTGNTLIHFKPLHKKPVDIKKQTKPEVFMLKDYDYHLGWSEEFDGYSDC